jgi:Ca2+-binding RTX toxin-like protein
MQIDGTDGDDVLVGTDNADVIRGKAGNDTINGGDGADDIDPGSGVDKVYGEAGADILHPSSVSSGFDDSQYDGGSGLDTFDYSVAGSGLFWRWYADGHVTVADNTIVNVEKFVSGSGSDTFSLSSNPLSVEVFGGSGDDYFSSSSNNFVGNILHGGLGSDYGQVAAGDMLFGDEGDDRFFVSGKFGGQVVHGQLDGGVGNDVLQTNIAFVVDLAAGTAVSGVAQFTVSGFEEVQLAATSGYVSTVYGDDHDNTLGINTLFNDGTGVIFHGRGGADTLKSGAGDDILDGGDGYDLASYDLAKSGVTVSLALTGAQDTGGAGKDTLAGVEALMGSRYNDILSAGLGNDSADLSGGDGDDQLHGGAGADHLVGGDGGDHLYGDAGNDVLDGGAGFDIVRYDLSAAGVAVDFVVGLGSGGMAQGDAYLKLEGVVGSAFADIMFGNSADNLFYGQGGDDVLSGGLGADVLEGGDGNDHLYGGAGGDVLRGGAGYDFVRYDEALGGVTGSLTPGSVSAGDALGDMFSGIEGLVGSSFADVLGGDGGGNTLYGQAGDDQIRGEAGDDVLDGGAGGDHLYGGAGADWLTGGAGYDLARYDTAGAVYVDLSLGRGFGGEAAGDVLASIEGLVGSGEGDTLVGDAQGNTIYGQSGDDVIKGEAGDDLVFGGDGADHLYGGAGADLIDGGQGFDFARFDGAGAARVIVDLKNGVTGEGDRLVSIEGLVASEAGDILYGDDAGNIIYALGGDDRIVGGAGADRLYGGAGADVFAFDARSGADVIADFEVAGAGHDLFAVQTNANGSGIVDFATLAARAANVGTDVVIDLGGGNTVTLAGLRTVDLSASLFMFY